MEHVARPERVDHVDARHLDRVRPPVVDRLDRPLPVGPSRESHPLPREGLQEEAVVDVGEVEVGGEDAVGDVREETGDPPLEGSAVQDHGQPHPEGGAGHGDLHVQKVAVDEQGRGAVEHVGRREPVPAASVVRGHDAAIAGGVEGHGRDRRVAVLGEVDDGHPRILQPFARQAAEQARPDRRDEHGPDAQGRRGPSRIGRRAADVEHGGGGGRLLVRPRRPFDGLDEVDGGQAADYYAHESSL